MNILFVCNEYPPYVSGGIGTATANVAKGLIRKGHNIIILGLYDKDLNEEYELVKVFRIKDPKVKFGNWFFRRFKLYNKAKEICKKYKVDIIEWPDYDGLLLFQVPNVINVIKIHGGHISHRLHGFTEKRVGREYLELRMIKKIDNWIGVSKWFNEEVKGYARKDPLNEEIIYNPVDMSLFKKSSERKNNVVIYAGGLKKRKGLIPLFKSANIFLRDDKELRLILYSFEADLNKDKLLSCLEGVEDQVEFKRFINQEELSSKMAKAKILIMPSYYESCGNSWIEGMACGIPVIGSKLSCGPEIVENEVTGYTCDPDNHEEIAEKVRSLLGNKSLREEMGNNGIIRVKNKFSLDIAVKKYEEYFNSLLKKY